MKFKSEYLIYFLVILLLLYAIWFITKHSEPISFSDIITFGGVLLACVGLLITSISGRLDRVENKVDEMVKDVQFIKGKVS